MGLGIVLFLAASLLPIYHKKLYYYTLVLAITMGLMYRQWAPRTVLCLFYVFTLVVGKMQKNSWEDLVPIKKNNFFRKVNFGTVVFCN